MEEEDEEEASAPAAAEAAPSAAQPSRPESDRRKALNLYLEKKKLEKERMKAKAQPPFKFGIYKPLAPNGEYQLFYPRLAVVHDGGVLINKKIDQSWLEVCG